MRPPICIIETVKTPQLDVRADRLRSAFNRKAQSRTDYIDATFVIGNELAEAKKELPANQDFSHWLKKEGFTLSDNDRAAVIYIAQHPDEARMLFEQKPDLYSWRLIADELKRLPRHGNTVMPPPKPPPPVPPPGHGVYSHSELPTGNQRVSYTSFTYTTAEPTAPEPAEPERRALTTGVPRPPIETPKPGPQSSLGIPPDYTPPPPNPANGKPRRAAGNALASGPPQVDASFEDIGSLMEDLEKFIDCDWHTFAEVANRRDVLPTPAHIRSLAARLERLARSLE